jgi:uncharacterized protein YfaS (alpha-2-macroglobulin family)
MSEPMRRDAIAAGFARLSAMQQASGHFSFWPGDSWEQPMLTPYVADLLLSAREQGEAIPEAVLEAALKRLSEDLLSGGDGYWNYENPAHLRFAARARHWRQQRKRPMRGRSTSATTARKCATPR